MFAANQTITLDPLQAIILLIGQLYYVTLHALLLVFATYIFRMSMLEKISAHSFENYAINISIWEIGLALGSLWVTLVKLP